MKHIKNILIAGISSEIYEHNNLDESASGKHYTLEHHHMPYLILILYILYQVKLTPWPESASALYQPSD
jgi:hypothetical protein